MAQSGQHPLNRRATDLTQQALQLGRESQLPEAGQVARRRQQARGKPLGADVVEALPDHPHDLGQLGSVDPPPLDLSQLALQTRSAKQPQETLARQAGHLLHLREQLALPSTLAR